MENNIGSEGETKPNQQSIPLGPTVAQKSEPAPVVVPPQVPSTISPTPTQVSPQPTITSKVPVTPPPASTPVKSKLKKNAEGAWDLIKFAVIALAIVIPIRMFIAQPFVVSGESMFPTFDDGQYIIVDEISYIVGHPQRGDVVIFKYPNDPSRFFIKRIIGLPNETVDIRDGVVTIINKENPKGFVLTEPYIDEKFSTTKTYTTNADTYFVMGDNRNRSSDSRTWGLLPRKLMVGRAFLRLMPIKEISYLPGAYKEAK